MGKTLPNQNDMEDFKDCIAKCNLHHPHSQGSTFTWSGGRRNGMVFRRLDRVLINEAMMQYFDDIFVKHLSKATSDHKPLLLSCSKENNRSPKPFRFIDAWTNHPSFIKVVSDYWSSSHQYGGMAGLSNKLRGLKAVLKEWNKSTFGNIFTNLKEAEDQAILAQEAYDQDLSPIHREADNKARAHLIQATNIELLFWKQKANLKWITEGDCNSKFFHAYVKGRRAKAKIRSICDQDGKEDRDLENISKKAVEHFSNAFIKTQSIHMEPLMEYLEEVISYEDNQRICKLPFEEEIKAAVWSLDPGSAPGPDGFNGKFFRSCWNIIKVDVISATQEFFTGIPIPKAYGSTFITLIPKNEKPKVFGDYRPISLSTFMSKINTRILADRIQALLPKIISPEQTGFQKGMGVEEQILLVEEMVHKIDTKVRGGNIIVKIDMAKAFDNLEWQYLQGVLNKLGFSTHAQNLLMANLKSTFLSILINGSPKGYFQMKRGVKQGDPLSPLLFIIAGEGLSRALNLSMKSSYITNYNTGRDMMISHLAFADDIIIFYNGECRNIYKLKHILNMYMEASGQQINYEKSKFYCGNKLGRSAISKIEGFLGMKHDKLPFKYLGAPICKGKLKKTDCGELLKHFNKYIDSCGYYGPPSYYQSPNRPPYHPPYHPHQNPYDDDYQVDNRPDYYPYHEEPPYDTPSRNFGYSPYQDSDEDNYYEPHGDNDDYDQYGPMHDKQSDPLVEEIIRLEQKIFYFDEVLFAEGFWYEPPYSRDYTLFAEEQIEANKVAIRERAKLLESVRKEKEFEWRLCEGSDMMQKMLDDFQRERLEAEAKADKLVNDLCKAVELKRSLQYQDQMREINKPESITTLAKATVVEPTEGPDSEPPMLIQEKKEEEVLPLAINDHLLNCVQDTSPEEPVLEEVEPITCPQDSIESEQESTDEEVRCTDELISSIETCTTNDSSEASDHTFFDSLLDGYDYVCPKDGWNLKSWDELLMSDDEDSSLGEGTIIIIEPQMDSQPIEDKEEINFTIKANDVDLLRRLPPPPTYTKSPPFILLPPSHRDKSRILDLDRAKTQTGWHQKRVKRVKLYDSRIGKSRKKWMDVAWMIPHGNHHTLRNLEELPLHSEEARKKFLTWGNTKMLQPPMVLDPAYLDELGHWQDIDEFLYNPKWRILLFLQAPASLEVTIEFLCSLRFLNNGEEVKSAAEVTSTTKVTFTLMGRLLSLTVENSTPCIDS
ncbi:unnamed protein product [Cuscuta campestris]|uniref:Reverse transcriptase domain-containing protein n=1 Tax=Cuscuta campestris TaxID=132261 RepID=A0A484LIY7_9ASTE|nr:unnamed protein product [Cuscuta campestris]